MEIKTYTNPMDAIRAKCLECSAGSAKEVRECCIGRCPLYDFRMGTNPHRAKRVLTDEQKALAVENLKKAHAVQAAKKAAAQEEN